MLKPGMVIMAEPNPITADGMFGIFLGHTFIITDTGHEWSTNSRWRSRWRNSEAEAVAASGPFICDGEEVVADAVMIKPVSNGQFPGIREKNREIASIVGILAIFARDNASVCRRLR